MAGRLTGKTALVTAAAAGIGRAIAEAFVAEGAKVWATDLDAEKLAGLEGAERRKLDVTSNDAVAALARETGPVDILVNAAGFVHHGTVLDTDDKDWEFSFDLNVKSMHRTIKAYPPRHAGEGRRLDRQHRLRRRLGARHPEPLRLRRHQGGGDRADQGGRGRLHQARHPRQRDLPRHDPVAVPRPAHRRRRPRRRARACRRCARPSSTASPWAGSARPRRSPGSRSISPRTRRAIRPGRSISPTVVLRCKAPSSRKPRSGYPGSWPVSALDFEGDPGSRCARPG